MKNPQNAPSRGLPAALLAVVATLAALVALAQDPQPDEAAAEADAAAPQAAEEGSPDVPLEDYEASEQISEDLSVSFPVDI